VPGVRAWAARRRSGTAGAAAAEAQDRTPAVTALAALAAVALIGATAWIVLDGAKGASPMLPYSPYFTGWLRHVGPARLTFKTFLYCLLVFTAGYALLLALARRLPTRGLLAVLGTIYVLLFIGPVLISTDVFSYIAYARLGVLHGLDPYTRAPFDAHMDYIYKFVGTDWVHTPTAYGPIYTLLSYPLALLGVVGAIWGMKVLATASMAVILWLTWRCAKARGLDPKVALVLVGANPLMVIYTLGGDHNDLQMVALMMAALALTVIVPAERPQSGGGRFSRLNGREAWAGAAVVAGAMVKATVAVMLPFMIVGRRRGSAIAGAAAMAVGGLLIGFLVFGIHGVDLVSALNRDSSFVSTDSFATEIAHLLGKPGVFPVDHTILKGMLVVIGVYVLWRTWRGYDWVAASGWALLAVAVTTTWLLAWYIIWPLPIAAVSRDRRLMWAVLAIQALFIVHQTSPLFTRELHELQEVR
jgi:hypothetical protein